MLFPALTCLLLSFSLLYFRTRSGAETAISVFEIAMLAAVSVSTIAALASDTVVSEAKTTRSRRHMEYLAH